MATIKGNFGGPGGPSGPQEPSIDISKTTPIQCESCNGSTFKQTLLLRKLSALVSPSGRATIVPIAVFACEKCDHVNEDFIKAEYDGILD